MRRLRFTIRQLMIAVVVVGIAMGIWAEFATVKRRQAYYRAQARFFAMQEADLRFLQEGHLDGQRNADESVRFFLKMKQKYPSPKSQLEITEMCNKALLEAKREAQRAESYTELVDYVAEMKRKYERAARTPWRPLEPDPPRPISPVEKWSGG